MLHFLLLEKSNCLLVVFIFFFILTHYFWFSKGGILNKWLLHYWKVQIQIHVKKIIYIWLHASSANSFVTIHVLIIIHTIDYIR